MDVHEWEIPSEGAARAAAEELHFPVKTSDILNPRLFHLVKVPL